MDEAWEDLLACHRLARLAGQGPTLVEAGGHCHGRDGLCRRPGLLQHARLTPAQIARMRADLDKLPPLPKMVDKINVAERFMYLDSVGMVARGRAQHVTGLTGGGKPKGMFESLMDSTAGKRSTGTTCCGWAIPGTIGLADACGKPPRSERERRWKRSTATSRSWRHRPRTGNRWACDAGQPAVRAVGVDRPDVGLHAAAGDLRSAIKAEDRATMQFEVTRLAFALAAYRADHGGYPAKLADLAPQYVAKVPRDIFNDAELHYRLQGGGYLLYSVGVNGKDDGGKGYDDRKGGEDWDDLAVRVPATSP